MFSAGIKCEHRPEILAKRSGEVAPWCCVVWWRPGVVVITTAQLHSTKPELRFCAGSNPARGVSEIRDGEDL